MEENESMDMGTLEGRIASVTGAALRSMTCASASGIRGAPWQEIARGLGCDRGDKRNYGDGDDEARARAKSSKECSQRLLLLGVVAIVAAYADWLAW